VIDLDQAGSNFLRISHGAKDLTQFGTFV